MVDAPSGPVTPAEPFPAPAPPAVRRPPPPLESAVVQAAVDGDESAFAAVFVAVDPLLRRYATVLVGAQADDVVGEAWLHIARDIRAFRGDADGFRGWCARIVRNRAVDLIRHDARRPSEPAADDRLDAVAPDDTALDALDNIATTRAVALIASLPREQAEAVMLRVVMGLDTRSASEVLGKSPGAVRVAAHRGLRRLAQLLGDAAGDGGPA